MKTLFHQYFTPKQTPSNGPIPKGPVLKMMYRNKEYVYNPREDITAYEVARMHLLITVVTHSSMDTELLNDYIDKYNLLRHFDTE